MTSIIFIVQYVLNVNCHWQYFNNNSKSKHFGHHFNERIFQIKFFIEILNNILHITNEILPQILQHSKTKTVRPGLKTVVCY